MVTPFKNVSAPRARHRQSAMLITELLIAVAFLCAAVIPLGYSFAKERQYLRTCYYRAVAMEIVDGEMELLVAGEWRSYTNGVHQIIPPAQAAKNLPPGLFQLNVDGKHLSLEWRPTDRDFGVRVTREVVLK